MQFQLLVSVGESRARKLDPTPLLAGISFSKGGKEYVEVICIHQKNGKELLSKLQEKQQRVHLLNWFSSLVILRRALLNKLKK